MVGQKQIAELFQLVNSEEWLTLLKKADIFVAFLPFINIFE
jgi:hypothetical protein